MSIEHFYLVAYDIGHPKRLRRVFRVMESYGEWVQLSVFQCRLSELRRMRMINDLELEIKRQEDHVLIVKLGLADAKQMDIVSLGRTFQPITRDPIII